MSESPSSNAPEPRRVLPNDIASKLMRNWPVVLVALGLVFMQWPVYVEWWKEWMAPLSYYSHGPMVPIIVVIMVMACRRKLAASTPKPSWLGLVIFVPAIVIYVVGRWIDSASLYGYSFVLLLGVVMLLAGTRWTRLLFIPIIFTASMVPASSSTLDKLTINLQIISTKFAAWLMTVTGYEATQQGTIISSSYLPSPLHVGAVCSGFRLMISLVTFTLFFVYMLKAPMFKRVILLVFSLPLALFVNALRIAMIGYVGVWIGTTSAMTTFHNWSGYLALVICFAILFSFAKLIRAADFDFGGGDSNSPAPPAPTRDSGVAKGAAIKGIIACLLLVLGGFAAIYAQPLRSHEKPLLVRESIPRAFGNWQGRDMQIDKEVLDYLKEGDLLERVFTNSSDGRQIDVLMETASDPNAFHDPTACLPGSGVPITAEKAVTLDLGSSTSPINATLLRASGSFSPKLVLYWYAHGGQTVRNIPELRRTIRGIQLAQVLGLASRVIGKNHSGGGSNAWVWYRISTDMYVSEDSEVATLKAFIKDFLDRSGEVVRDGQ